MNSHNKKMAWCQGGWWGGTDLATKTPITPHACDKLRRDGFCDACRKRNVRSVPRARIRVVDAVQVETDTCQSLKGWVRGDPLTVRKRERAGKDRFVTLEIGDAKYHALDCQLVCGQHVSDRYSRGNARVPANHRGPGPAVLVVTFHCAESAKVLDGASLRLRPGPDVVVLFDAKRASMRYYCSVATLAGLPHCALCTSTAAAFGFKRSNRDLLLREHLAEGKRPKLEVIDVPEVPFEPFGDDGVFALALEVSQPVP